jgi:NAD(P)-dependent dehydrogenase (short-subunit alcohol dehydrogenase family)
VQRFAAMRWRAGPAGEQCRRHPPGTLLQVEDDRWRKAWDLKVFGFISLTRALYPRMAARKRGVIINVIGAAGEKFPAAYIAGASGNAALMAFTRALGRASPKDGIRVVGINPGPVATERQTMLARHCGGDNAGRRQALGGDVPRHALRPPGASVRDWRCRGIPGQPTLYTSGTVYDRAAARAIREATSMAPAEDDHASAARRRRRPSSASTAKLASQCSPI